MGRLIYGPSKSVAQLDCNQRLLILFSFFHIMSELPSDVSWCFSPRVAAELQLEVTNSSLRVRREEHDASSGKKTGKKLFADGHE